MLRTKIHIVFSAIGCLLGISAFICFCVVYPNIQAGVWALLSAIHAGLALMLHCHFLKDSLHMNFSRKALRYIGDIGIVGFVCGMALTFFYLFLQLYYNSPEIFPMEIIRLVWSFMMMKWGFLLYYTTRTYLKTYNDHHLFSDVSHIEET